MIFTEPSGASSALGQAGTIRRINYCKVKILVGVLFHTLEAVHIIKAII
jgi:hypothetical protein